MAGIRMENKIYEVGVYCRLSKDDGTENESASIATQKSILTDYVKKQGWHLAKTYVDDGYSGTIYQDWGEIILTAGYIWMCNSI